jgi:hypothetical protein
MPLSPMHLKQGQWDLAAPALALTLAADDLVVGTAGTLAGVVDLLVCHSDSCKV